jgi:hypothetical protein
LEDICDVFAFGWCGEKLGFSSFRIEEAASGVEFAEVKRENLHVYLVLVFVGWSECDKQPQAAQITGPSRQLFLTNDSHPSNLGLTWILSSKWRRFAVALLAPLIRIQW